MRINKTKFGLIGMIMLVLVLVLAASVSAQGFYGYVFDGTQTGVNNTNVILFNATSSPINSTLSNASGFYNLTFDVATGVYIVNFDAPGFNEVNRTKVIMLGASAEELNVTLETPQTGNISGVVKDLDGNALPGATILYEDGSVGFTTTDENGNYNAEVFAGNYNITASFAGYSDVSFTGINATVGQTTAQDFTLELAQRVSGYVKSGSGILAGASVSITGTGLSTVTNASGYFIIKIIGGEYELSASKAGYITNSVPIEIINGQMLSQNISLSKQPSEERGGGGASGGGTRESKTEKIKIGTSPTIKSMIRGDRLRFNFGKENHSIKVDKIGLDYVQITVASTPVVAKLSLGDEKQFDLDGDKKKDLSVKLRKVVRYYKEAEIEIKLLRKPPIEKEPEPEEKVKEKIKEEEEVGEIDKAEEKIEEEIIEIEEGVTGLKKLKLATLVTGKAIAQRVAVLGKWNYVYAGAIIVLAIVGIVVSALGARKRKPKSSKSRTKRKARKKKRNK